MISINLSSLVANGSSPKFDPTYPTGNRPAISPYFPAGYFVTAQLPMTVVRPRPNVDVVGMLSYDHNAYVGIETRIKVTVQGGAFPFFIENAILPSGATMGNTYFDTDYMIFKYTPSALGNQNVSFDIVDQDGTRKSVSWTINVNVDWVRFVAASGNDSTGTGSYAAPWATIEQANTAMTGGRALCLKDGTYTLTTAGKVMSSSKFNSIFAEHERGATVDGSGIVTANNGRHFYINSPSTFIGGIRFINPTTAGDNPRWFSDENTACNNTWMDNCYFDIAGRMGVVNDDNVSCFFLGGNAADPARRSNVAQTRNDFVGFIGVANGWSCIDYYCTDHVVIENNTFESQVGGGTTSAGTLWVKGAANTFTSIRSNEFKDYWSGTLIDIYIANTTGEDNVTGNVEVCYNIVRGTGGSVIIARGSQSGARLPVYMYRNTIIGSVSISYRTFPVTFSSDSDIIIHNYTNVDPWKIYVFDPNDPDGVYRPFSYMSSLTGSVMNYELHLTSATGVLDTALKLTGASRTSWLGKRGAEIYKP